MSSDATSADRARLAAVAAASKTAVDTVVLEVGHVLAIVDYFVVTSSANPRHARAVAEEVEEQLRRSDGNGPLQVEGADDARWILLDFGDVVVHILSEEARAYYEIERLWGDVDRLDWDGQAGPALGESAGAAGARVSESR